MAQQEADRRRDERSALWRAFLESGSATADEPPLDQPRPALEAAMAHVGQASCALAILPMEDALGMAEQPNLPGTTEGHPNWRRRLPGEAAHLLDDPAVVTRLQAFARTRRAEG
jgi:4-alpha-glucanotransferase